MDDIVVLDQSVLANEEDNSYVEYSEDCYFKVEFFAKDTEKHNEYNDEVSEVLPPFSDGVKIGIAKGINLEHPFVEELRDCGCVPPIKVEMAMFQLSYLCH
jgi:hypothetical protein